MTTKILTCILFALSFTLNAQDGYKFITTKKSDLDLPEIKGKLPSGVITWQRDKDNTYEFGIEIKQTREVKIEVLDDEYQPHVVLVDKKLNKKAYSFFWNHKNYDKGHFYLKYTVDGQARVHSIKADRISLNHIINRIKGVLFR